MAFFNLVDWVNWTVSWATLTTDRFWNSNSAYSFDWVDDWINIPNNSTTNNLQSFSIWGWVKITSFNTNQMPFSKNWKWFNIKSTGVIEWDVSQITTSAHSTTTNTVTAWVFNHIVYTYTASVVEIYLNWVKCSYSTKTTGVGNVTADDTKNWLIWRYEGAWYYLNWVVDGVLILNRALSADEVKQLYELTSKDYIYPAPSYDLLSLREWLVLDLNEQGKDLSWNWNNATLVNTPVIIRQGKAKGLVYNWSNQYLTTTTSFTFTETTPFTLNVIFNTAQIKDQYIINTYLVTANYYYIWIWLISGKIIWMVTKQSVLWNQVLSTTSYEIWKTYDATFTYDWTNMKIYINAIYEWAATRTFTWATQLTSPFDIARHPYYSDWSYKFNWKIFKSKCRNKVLTQKEIEANYYANKWNYIY